MPTKSNGMSPMPMQSKIGEASLKFGPDWLRALSSSDAPGGNTSPSADSPHSHHNNRAAPGFLWGPNHNNDFNQTNRQYSQGGGGSKEHSFRGENSGNSGGGASARDRGDRDKPRTFKASENHYSREEMLALFDKNLDAPAFLLSFGTLFIEKMQPPLAFSQPSEEEIRIWHSPQPESSRQGGQVGGPPVGRGYAIRGGRGGGMERGRGRGRGGYYAPRPHDEDERQGGGSFSRPRNFERSQSNHERVAWGDRNGVGGPPGAVDRGEENNRGGGGNWRSRDFGGSGRGRHGEEGGEDGWRKPRWRRGDDDSMDDRGNMGGRRVHRSWSEDDGHDNIPEWARDNPSEESGTFDSSGAFHGERSSNRDGDKGAEGSESHASHHDRVQKRDKPVIPARVVEEGEEEKPPTAPSISNTSKEESSRSNNSHSSHNNEEDHYRSMTEEAMNLVSKLIEEDGSGSRRQQVGPGTNSGPSAGSNVSSQRPNNLQLQHNQQNHTQHQHVVTQVQSSQSHSISSTQQQLQQQQASQSHSGQGQQQGQQMSQMQNHPALQQQQQPDSHSRHAVQQSQQQLQQSGQHQQQNSVAPVQQQPQQEKSPGQSYEVWFYRDPQGSVQGPFATHEMSLWCSQGYFNAQLLLRRECDKCFVSLLEMGKLYGRNPFTSIPDSPIPPPIQEPGSSALEFPLQQAQQLQQQRLLQQQQQQQQQQHSLRDSSSSGAATHYNMQGRKEDWPSSGSQVVGGGQTRTGGQNTLTAEQIQAQLLLSMAKSQQQPDANAIDQLQALFHRQQQMKNATGGGDKNSAGRQSQMENSSGSGKSDPIQSLVAQLTNMANSGLKMKPDVLPSPWQSVNVPQQQQVPPPVPVQSGWGATPPSRWDYPNHPSLNHKLREDEDARRRLMEEEEIVAERARLEEEERKRLLLLEEEEREQRRIREEQYLLQKQREELLKRQQEEDLQRQKELMQRQLEQRQLEQRQLEQQRQLRDEQTRLAEEAQRLERERQERERLERERMERLDRERLDRERKEREELEQQQQKAREEKERHEREEMMRAAQFSWSSGGDTGVNVGGSVEKSLIEIQEEEARQQVKDQEKKRREQDALSKMQQREREQREAQQKALNLKWAQGAQAPISKAPIKSLTEIQAEEQAKLQKQQEKEREKRAIIHQHQQQQQAWSAQLTWANRASALAAQNQSQLHNKKVNGGAWGEETMASKIKSSGSSNSSGAVNRPPTKKTKDEQDFMKLFSVGGSGGSDDASTTPKRQQNKPPQTPQDEFTRWCFERLGSIGGSTVDIPTFVSFLKEVESPYEVGDYVRSYLGEGKDAREFTREFLERRSRWKNARKEGGEDNLCRPASAINPNSNDFQEVKAKGKKGAKKGKMQKVDSRILGFSTSGATDRLNVGNRDYGDSTD